MGGVRGEEEVKVIVSRLLQEEELLRRDQIELAGTPADKETETSRTKIVFTLASLGYPTDFCIPIHGLDVTVCTRR